MSSEEIFAIALAQLRDKDSQIALLKKFIDNAYIQLEAADMPTEKHVQSAMHHLRMAKGVK